MGVDGSVLWSRRFGIELDERVYSNLEAVNRSLILVNDIDGDGINEVLVGVQRGAALAEAEGLYVFNGDGSRRFHYRPIHRVQFGPYRGAPPWVPNLIAVQPSSGHRKSIWLASATSYYPSVLERIGPDGRPDAAYWSDGYINTVRFATLDGRAVVLAGGDNNEWRGGSLAVLDLASPTATAPAVKPDYRCTAGCSTAEPLAFVVWPGSPMHQALGGTEPVWGQINVLDDGQIQVITGKPGGWTSTAGENSLPLSSNRLYVLDSRLRLVSAELAAEYRGAYEHVRSLIGLPPFDPRPEHHLYPMLRWERGRFVRVDHPEVGVLAGRQSQ